MILKPPDNQYAKIAFFFAVAIAYAVAASSLGQISGAYFDSEQYIHYGWNLLESGQYGATIGRPDMNREPAYAAYLAGLLWTLKLFGANLSVQSLLKPDHLFFVKGLQALTLFLCAGFTAFRAQLPVRLQWPFFLLAILSPSCISIVREIYSEALAVPLALLLLGCVSLSFKTKTRIPSFAAGLFFGLMVLTKSYLYFASFLFLSIAAISLLPRLRIPRTAVLLFLCMGLSGFAAQKAWDFRNLRVFGENASEARLSIALAGKVARLHEAEWPKDLAPALAASLGTNFCDGIFGPDRCSRFDYRGCDVIGLQNLLKYKEQYVTNRAADSALKKDMFSLWMRRPATQLFGSGLELLRMFFFEAVMDSGTFPDVLRLPARIWHLAGSLIFWAFILTSFTRHRRHWSLMDLQERSLALGCALVIAYHAFSMAQITNVVRYVFPILPLLYYFVADGIAVLLERNQIWTIKPANRKS